MNHNDANDHLSSDEDRGDDGSDEIGGIDLTGTIGHASSEVVEDAPDDQPVIEHDEDDDDAPSETSTIGRSG